MSIRTVAEKDLVGARRSRPLWVAAAVLALIVVLVIYAPDPDVERARLAVQALFVLLVRFLSVALPIIALVASYVALAGERQGGGIKFLLSMPNTRLDVYAGKLASRLVVVAAAAVVVYVAATAASLTKYGAFAGGVVVGSFLLTVVYGSVFVSVAIAISGAVATRSRAIAGALVSYFVLVIPYALPGVSHGRVVRWLHHSVLGFESNPDLYNAVRHASPYLAYQKAVNLVLPAGLERRFFMTSADPELPLYLSDGFSLVVLAFWLVVPVLVGFWAFERADLE